MNRARWRVRILCEDRRTEQFVCRLCKRYDVRVEHVAPAPAGKGSASAWVRLKYATSVRKRRSKNFQANLGLLVVIDGDNVGVEGRLRELAQQLEDAAIDPRGPDEAIAVFVPTWSIETWLAHLTGADGVDEKAPLKLDERYRVLWNEPKAASETIKTAVAGWDDSSTPLPSHRAALAEARRIGLMQG